jgi:hypothetical protein
VGKRFSAPVQTDPGAHSSSYTVGTGSFPGVKRPGRGFDHLPLSSDEVTRKNIAIPLLPIWAFVACCRVNFTFTVTYSGDSVPAKASSDRPGIFNKHG